MIALYGLYILIMVHNETIKAQVTRAIQSNPTTAKLISSAGSLDGPDDVFGSSSSSALQMQQKKSRPNYQSSDSMIGQSSCARKVEDDSMFLAALLVIMNHKRLFGSQLRFQCAVRYVITKRQHRAQLKSTVSSSRYLSNEVNYFGPENEPLRGSNEQRQRIEAYAKSANISKSKFSIVAKDDYEFWNRAPDEGESKFNPAANFPPNLP